MIAWDLRHRKPFSTGRIRPFGLIEIIAMDQDVSVRPDIAQIIDSI
jgi:hypothetical protein